MSPYLWFATLLALIAAICMSYAWLSDKGRYGAWNAIQVVAAFVGAVSAVLSGLSVLISVVQRALGL